MPKKKNMGVSMVEILISITIFAVLMIPIVKGIITSMNNTTTAKTLQNRNEFASNIIEYLKTDSLDDIMNGKYLKSIGTTDFKKYADFYVGMSDSSFNTLTDESDKIAALDENLADIYKKVKSESNGSANIYRGLELEKAVLKEDGTPVTNPDGTVQKTTEYSDYEEYAVAGKIRLGTKNETYTYKAAISNKDYAEKGIIDDYADPNNLAMGIVEDIDHNKIALFNGTIANYDTTVSNAFLTKKIEILKSVDPDWYEIYYNQVKSPNIFPNDTVTRLIIIKIAGDYNTGYDVSCTLEYRDNSETRSEVRAKLNSENYKISYTPFSYHYDAKTTLPNIYLMYNCCLYNDRYSADDYIVFDTSELDVGVDETDPTSHVTRARCFIIQTAEKYSQKLVDSNATKQFADDDGNVETGLDSNQIMYNSNVSKGNILRKDVKVHLLATKASKLNHLSVYHNFDIQADSDETGITASKEAKRYEDRLNAVNSKSSNIYYSDLLDDQWFGKLATSIAALNMTNYKPLKSYDDDGKLIVPASVADFKPLDYAKEESRGLYTVKLWVVKGDIDPATIQTNEYKADGTKNPAYSDPMLTATRGGNESR